jgi:DNA-binding NarL/FixJ family response regulator
LEEILEEGARVHVGHEPPAGETPSSIIFCTKEAGDVASEVKRLREIAPYTPILIFNLHVDLEIGKAAFQAGVHGFIHAKMQPAQIVNAISLASSGEVVIPKELLRGLVVEEETPTGTAALTSRQREILSLVTKGLTNAQIAQQLYLSEFTIKQHLRHAYKLLKVKNRTQAAELLRNEA